MNCNTLDKSRGAIYKGKIDSGDIPYLRFLIVTDMMVCIAHNLIILA